MESEKIDILKSYKYLEYLVTIEEKKNTKNEIKITEIKDHFEKFFDVKDIKKDDYKDAMEEIVQGKIDEKMMSKAWVKGIHDITRNGDSLLLKAMSIKKVTGEQWGVLKYIIDGLITNYPFLICLRKNHTEIKGVTPVHLATVQGNVDLLRSMAAELKNRDIVGDEQETICATGPQFYGTAMMAGTLLGIATLMCNETIFTIILYNFNVELDVINEKGDNIIHSLIKYAHIQPEKLEPILGMLTFILTYKFIRKKSANRHTTTKTGNKYVDDEELHRKQVGKLLMMKNKEKLTPLQLAAKRQQFKMFEIMIKHEIYLSKETSDSVLHENKYDITEIDTLALANGVEREHNEDIKPEYHESVLEYVLHHQTNNAFLFTNVTPVNDVIREKWLHYRLWFFVWFFIYLIFMIFLSVAAVYRTQLKGFDANDTDRVKYEYEYCVMKDVFVSVVSFVGLAFAGTFIAIEGRRKKVARFSSKTSTLLRKKVKMHLSLPYSNVMFRFYFVIFSILLILDFICATLVSMDMFAKYENYCLIFAVIIGWYLVLFFIQAFKSFSFYSVLIQRVLTDMLKMAFIMSIFLIAFSIAMFMIMQGAGQEDFDNIWKTMVKMITIMLGLGEIDVLYEARQPILAVLVFLLFVLLTTILLLNALIAMMSNTCTDLTSSYAGFVASKMHYRLQKLSIILFLEGFLPLKFCKEVGNVKKVYRFDNEDEKYKMVKRRFWTRSFVKGHGEIESPKELLQPSVSYIDHFKNELTKTINSRFNKWPKLEHLGNNKVSGERAIIKKRIDITDVEKKQCERCKDNTVMYMQSQEIEEVNT